MSEKFPTDVPSYFADAEANFDQSDLVIYGVPYDRTVSFRQGTRFGPESIRKASWNFESFNFHTGIDLQNHHFHDYGNLDVDNNISSVQLIDMIRQFTSSLNKRNKKPVVLGGEHTITAGVVEALPKDTFVLVFFSYSDYRNEFQGQRYNHACTLRRIVDHVGHDHVFLCGLRSAGKDEYAELLDYDISFLDSYSFYEHDRKHLINQIISKINHQPVYVSLDIDVFDPSFAPGTGTIEPLGIQPYDVLCIIDKIAKQIIGFDVMEVNPLFDNGETSFLAAKLIRHTLERLLEK